MNPKKITFTLTKENIPYSGTVVFSFWNGIIKLSSEFEGHDRPLVLKACAAYGDRITAVFLDYRMELYVNGRLIDEEWPEGEYLSDFVFMNVPRDYTIEDYIADEKELTPVLGTFTSVSNWLPGENVFVGDCMPYSDGKRYHVIYLKDRHHHSSKWGKGAHQWEHISTDDFLTWQIHPTAVPISRQWEGSICTGSHIEIDGVHYLYYTIRTMDGSPAPICRSVSYDGYNYKKDFGFSFSLSDKYQASSARDPKIIKDDDGRYHMLVTTTLRASNRGCLAHLISDDNVKWYETGNPVYVSDSADEPECPDYICVNGRYYLIFSLRGKGYYLVSEKPFSDFRSFDNNVIPCNSVPKCAIWKGKIVFTGFKGINGYAGRMCFLSASVDALGRMIFE